MVTRKGHEIREMIRHRESRIGGKILHINTIVNV